MDEARDSPAPLPDAASPPAPGLARRRRPLSPRALAARRANLVKARASDPDLRYRPTERRRAASLANIQKAIARRRSPEGNDRARLNALKHGLDAGTVHWPGEGPDDLNQHRARVRRIFRPRTEQEDHLAERLARDTWRRMQLFRAQARYDQAAWLKLGARAGREPQISDGQFSDRVDVVFRFLFRGERLEEESWKVETRIQRILKALLHERRGKRSQGLEAGG